MGGWDFSTFLREAARRWPQRDAIVHGTRRVSWTELERRSAVLATAWRDAGVVPGDVVTPYLRNVPEHVEVLWAALGSAVAPMNTNYRYLDDELVAIWADAGVRVVVFATEFRDRVERVRHRVPSVALWIEVGGDDVPAWALDYSDLVGSDGTWPDESLDLGSSLILIYTGGTTGRPKGVMWRQADLLSLLDSQARRPLTDRAGVEEISRVIDASSRPLVSLVASPLMHGAGLFALLGCLTKAGTAVTLTSPRLDPVELLDAVDAEGVVTMSIVGDAFARPLVDALDAEPGRWSLDSLRAVYSSGVMWSGPIKERLLEHARRARLIDGLGSSEAFGVASAESVRGGVAGAATFRPSSRTAVLLDDGTLGEPGDGRIGRLAVSGWLPLGYHGDPVKSAEVFVEAAGKRWSVPGDMAVVEDDGAIRLLGRGSSCINTGGEKVFVEEVEEALKGHAQVLDAAVIGIADDRLGQRVVAFVETADPAPTAEEVIAHARTRLAGYKVPREIALVATVGRGPNGKLDHRELADRARERWAAT